MIRRSAMMAAPPADQHHESAGDSENGSFRHFFTHLVCMRERLIDCDLRDSGLVTRIYRGPARARSQSICSSECVISNQRPVFIAILPAGSSRCHCASAGFADATKDRIAYPSSELSVRGKPRDFGFAASSVPRRRQIQDRSRRLCPPQSSQPG